MGNCLRASPSREERKAEKYAANHSTAEPSRRQSPPANSSTLQHISEREPEDIPDDPSNHPTASTLFLARSKSELREVPSRRWRRKSHYDNHSQASGKPNGIAAGAGDGSGVKRYSSCSTIFIDDSTVSQPNLKNTIKAIALAVYFHIKNRKSDNAQHWDASMLEIFDEGLHPLTRDPVPHDYAKKNPEQKTIYRFVRTLFNQAQLTAECAIVTLVYLERLLTYSEFDLCPANWKRVTLGAIMLASKVWDDQAVWNVDYCQIIKDLTVEDMNTLERSFLEMLQFNINVPSSVYAKYYFDLRALAAAHDLSLPFEPLSKDRARKLEAMSNVYEDKMRNASVRLKRSNSLDGLTTLKRLNKAIIS